MVSSCWVYIETPHFYVVGFYNPKGEWVFESKWPVAEKAAQRVHYLNGGNNK